MTDPLPLELQCGVISHSKLKIGMLKAFERIFADWSAPLELIGNELEQNKEKMLKDVHEYISTAGPKQTPLDIVILEANLGKSGSENLSFDSNFFYLHGNRRFVLFSEHVTDATVKAAGLPENVLYHFKGPATPSILEKVRDLYLAQVQDNPFNIPNEPANPYPDGGEPGHGNPADPKIDVKPPELEEPGAKDVKPIEGPTG
jgi:hypothetical protein